MNNQTMNKRNTNRETKGNNPQPEIYIIGIKDYKMEKKKFFPKLCLMFYREKKKEKNIKIYVWW